MSVLLWHREVAGWRGELNGVPVAFLQRRKRGWASIPFGTRAGPVSYTDGDLERAKAAVAATLSPAAPHPTSQGERPGPVCPPIPGPDPVAAEISGA